MFRVPRAIAVCVTLSTVGACQTLLDFAPSADAGVPSDASGLDAATLDAPSTNPDSATSVDGSSDAARKPDVVQDAGALCPPPGDLFEEDCAAVGAGASGKTAYWNGRCYFTVWPSPLPDRGYAAAECKNRGAYIATITCAKEHLAAVSIVDNIFHLGARRASASSPWAWDQDEPWSFTAWPSGIEPTSDPLALCLWYEKSGTYYPARCDATAPVLCEIGPRAPPQ